MIQLTEYRLAFRSGFHLGTRGVNLEERAVCLPSDTLFAALVHAFRRMGGEPEAFIAPFPRADGPDGARPPFTLTSAFPYAGGVRFFPLPVGLGRFFKADTLKARRKAIRRVRFLSEALLRRLLAGEKLDGWLFPEDARVDPTTGVALQGGALWLELSEHDQLPATLQETPPRALRQRRIYAPGRVPRVTVDRVSSASEIFHAGRMSFAPGCGLWFGVHWLKPEQPVGGNGWSYREALARVLAMLQDEGVGGERSTGYGAFDLQEGKAPLTLDDPAPGGLALLLSRYHPRNEELPAALSDGGTAYELSPVGGWLQSWDGAAQRRKRLWLVSEGSLVRAVGPGPWGDIVDVRPEYKDPAPAFPHPVWRYGLALGAALKEANDG
jgi:CRISPR-associated protein Csm4